MNNIVFIDHISEIELPTHKPQGLKEIQEQDVENLHWKWQPGKVEDPRFGHVKSVFITKGNQNLYDTIALSAGPGTNSVHALPMVKTGNSHYLLMRLQYRPVINTWNLEIPGGFGEPNQGDDVTVKQELREEMGIEESQILSLGPVGPVFSCDRTFMYPRQRLYIAEIELKGEFNPEPEEFEAFEESNRIYALKVSLDTEFFEIDGFTNACWLAALNWVNKQ
jgi:ADP-ribose pyrophosphatase YjhB (NUDIX family)